jgi:HD-GYP domain-containing protein (c-di-GMP phosphodiesterase class II)
MAKEYFLIEKSHLKSEKTFPFKLFIYNKEQDIYTLFLHANSPLKEELEQFLDYILQRGGKLAVSFAQKRTFLKGTGLKESEVDGLKKRATHPQEKAYKLYDHILKERIASEEDQEVVISELFKSAFHQGDLRPLIKRAREEICAFSPYISKTTSLATFLAEELLIEDNTLNRIVCFSYFLAKQIDIKDEEALGDLIVASFLHHLGKTQINYGQFHRPSVEYSDLENKYEKQHPGLTQHLIRKFKTDISERAIQIILQHHERSDGTGFPEGKKEEHIDQLAFILGCASHLFEILDQKVSNEKLTFKSAVMEITSDSPRPGISNKFGESVSSALKILSI